MVTGICTLVVLFVAALLWYARRRTVAILPEEDSYDFAVFRDSVATVAPPPVQIIEPAPAQASENNAIMADFATSYTIVKGHEGAYQNSPNDGGNFNSLGHNVGTNWGINAQVYEAYLNRPPTEENMREMPKEVALMLFKREYWDKMRGDDIRNQRIADILFDGFVNHGGWGIKMIQGAVNVPRDGRIGPITIAAINRADPRTLFYTYKAIRRAGYLDLIRRRPWMKEFKKGWLKRIDSFHFSNSAAGETVLALSLIGLAIFALRS